MKQGPLEFRVRLVNELFDHSERLRGSVSIPKPIEELLHRAAVRDHGQLERLGDIPRTYRACRLVGRKTIKQQAIRKPLEELSVNTVKTIRMERKRPEQVTRSRFRCKRCAMYLCNDIRCWNELDGKGFC